MCESSDDYLNLDLVEVVGPPDDVHELGLLVGTDGVDLVALSGASLAADVRGQIELHGGSGDVELASLAEEGADHLLVLSEALSGLGVNGAHQLLGAVVPVVIGGLENDVLNAVLSRAAITAARVAPAATAAASESGTDQESATSGGLQAEETGKGESAAGDGDTAGEDGLARLEHEGGREGDNHKFRLLHL